MRTKVRWLENTEIADSGKNQRLNETVESEVSETMRNNGCELRLYSLLDVMHCSLVERCCFCFQCRSEEWRWKEQSPLKQPNYVTPHSKTVTWMLIAVYSDNWIFCSWNLYSPWLYTLFIGPTKTSIRTINFPWTYVCAPTQFLYYTVRLSPNWSVVVILSTFNWKSGNRSDFQLQFLTCISSVFCDTIGIMHCIRCSYPAQMLTLIHSYSRPAKARPVAAAQLAYYTVHSLLCTKMFTTFIQLPHYGCPQQYCELAYKVQQE
jgi:hypothetical protein